MKFITKKCFCLINFYFLIGLCPYSKNDKVSVTFLNLDKFPIDIKRYDENWKEKLVKSRVYPENQYAHEVFFRQYFFFERSDSNQSLQASANGVTADFFEGCRFKAEAGRPLTVRISRGIKLILFL